MINAAARIKNCLEKVISDFTKIEKGKIVIIDGTPYSGSSAHALYKFISESIKYTNIKILSENDLRINRLKNLRLFIKNFKEVCSANVILTTHIYRKYKKSQVYIQLWHGIPLKAMALMDKTENADTKKMVPKNFSQYDYIISSSPFYNTLLNSCIGVDGSKYIVTGFPRNDMLFNADAKEKLQKIIGQDISGDKIIFYLPTFKAGYYNDRIEGATRKTNIFGFDSFNYDQFNDFLVKNNIIFIAKLHPFEENIFKAELSKKCSKNFILLTSDVLKEHKVDLYEILGSANMLITDYSSVYFDFLLLDRPLLFINNDIDMYEEKRGFLLGPYDFWTPGPKVKNQNELEIGIIKSIMGEDEYIEQRKSLINVFHTYRDNKSSQRVWNIIKMSFRKDVI
ncbi:CDP-glycerol glycerophosphotransferase, TagB/SpsB family [Caldanaerobius fijiensis DSM 17918]|uniref:CDP-glycerol glycerophosphotransferase, TagB/SpsB family n=1 Tax=Caldanaerobius fijiensis DSM 17918 TaxID=1121256 RepID=A0A1M4VIA5_9THEO|nr:CDP-glycerol glycerophosphotransferase family protein [Caldanaerobius fijiensis]SHE68592.1 CDP-glycerol glycerophosphotransferase, TagB/SpsB family [Caldanaerobius fijiensis DSM 17918]